MTDKLEIKISDVLKDLGIPTSMLGYFYLKYGVGLLVEDISLIKGITKKLYPLIADKFNTTAMKVERAIRHAIEVGWERGNLKTQNKLFGYTVSANKRKPTNSEFLSTVADWLIMNNCAKE